MGKILTMVAQCLALGLLTLFVVSLIIFLSVELLPGDLAEALLGQAATPETVAALRRELNLDLPPHARYLDWLGGILQGDMGRSLANKREIAELIGVRLANTLFLALMAAIIAVPLAVTLGVFAALYRNSFYDRGVNVVTLSTISFPEFFVAYILILFLSVTYRAKRLALYTSTEGHWTSEGDVCNCFDCGKISNVTVDDRGNSFEINPFSELLIAIDKTGSF